MLTVWGRRSSFNLQKVMWLVDELGLEHEHIELGGRFGGLDEPEFRARNPHGKVPVVDDGGTLVWESHAILRYLAACHGGSHWWPEAAAERVWHDQWMDWSQSLVQPDFLMGVFWGFYRTPAQRRDEVAVAAAVKACARHFRLLDQVLEDRPFVSGTQLGLADVPLGTCLYRYFNLDIERPDVPNVVRWYERLSDRAAYQAHVMVPFEELFGRLDY